MAVKNENDLCRRVTFVLGLYAFNWFEWFTFKRNIRDFILLSLSLKLALHSNRYRKGKTSTSVAAHHCPNVYFSLSLIVSLTWHRCVGHSYIKIGYFTQVSHWCNTAVVQCCCCNTPAFDRCCCCRFFYAASFVFGQNSAETFKRTQGTCTKDEINFSPPTNTLNIERLSLQSISDS